ncbi:glycosyltransferase family 4 protein [Bradyrhizobium vignae]|uniref:Glycosyltransferase n=1 Tax=Bradyrhizobium vignae TaxID=1549949 RepID=A0A2U3PYG7_9BRAD|nr:glycosyltransferase family 4 protein [Bradyrhizobium vignae]SPP94149.1 conserved protein of unknown function [Bradyrhizobium vignae]
MKSILLVNPISGRGHLDAYARLYSRALVELGNRVILLAETDGGAADYLARTSSEAASSFSFVSFDQARSSVSFDQAQTPVAAQCSARSQMNALRRAQLVWQEEGAIGILRRGISVPMRTMRPKLGRVKRALVRRFLRTKFASGLNVPTLVDFSRIQFYPLLDCIDKLISTLREPRPDLVLFLYLDLMVEHAQNTMVLDRPGALPWIGILFHPRLARSPHASAEGYFRTANVRGGIFLVPSAIPAYAKIMQHLHFALVPDVADLELPAELPELARDIRKQAGSRKIILQIGSITAHKGIQTLLDVIVAADPNRFFFVLIGEVHWETFGEHQDRIRTFYARQPHNVYISQGYVRSEADYNAVIAASDIIYAVYQDFSSSSNALAKAAGLYRPILVSESSLMGDRVRRFNIGAVAPEGDAQAILERIDWLSKQPKEGFSFESYNEAQSLDALKRSLADALPSWLVDSTNGRTKSEVATG